MLDAGPFVDEGIIRQDRWVVIHLEFFGHGTTRRPAVSRSSAASSEIGHSSTSDRLFFRSDSARGAPSYPAVNGGTLSLIQVVSGKGLTSVPLLRDVTPASDSAASLRWLFKVDVDECLPSCERECETVECRCYWR